MRGSKKGTSLRYSLSRSIWINNLRKLVRIVSFCQTLIVDHTLLIDSWMGIRIFFTADSKSRPVVVMKEPNECLVLFFGTPIDKLNLSKNFGIF